MFQIKVEVLLMVVMEITFNQIPLLEIVIEPGVRLFTILIC